MKDPNKRLMINQQSRKNRKYFGQMLFFLFIGVFAIIICRFSYISIGKKVQNVNLSASAQKLYTDNTTLKAKRGTIYDDNGQAIAEDTSVYSLYAVLDTSQKSTNGKKLYVTDKAKAAKVLAKYLPMSEKKARQYLSPKGKPFQVEFGAAGQNISLTTKNKIESYHLTGLDFVQQEARLYPNGVFASHIIGQADATNTREGTKLVGTMGIEKAFNSELTGKNGKKKVSQDSYGYQLANTKQDYKPAKDGDNVYTTLDTRLQTLLESEMSSVYKQVHPKSMNAVLMNAQTGAILAASQRPTFDAQTKDGLNSIWRDTLVEDAYEPGSTMKIFTMASSIDSGNYNGNATYQSGKYKIGNQTVPDWNTNGWGTISYNKGFALSSNVAMAHLEQQMGAKKWKEYIDRFKFLKSTNIGLPNETAGSIVFKRPIEQADTAFGQGIQVSAMQMMQALSAIGNNGTMLKPYLVSKVTNSDGKTVKQYGKQVVGHPVSAKTAKEVRKHMEDVVYKSYGIGSDFKMSGYKVAAKTGTAQVSNGASGYLTGDNSYLYSVAAMVPADHPKYIMYITMKQPTLGDKSATKLTSSIMKPVMERALSEDAASTATADQVATVKMPNVTGLSSAKAEDKLKKLNVKVTTLGSGKVITSQHPATGTSLYKNQRILLQTSGQVTMPNIKGWSKGDVLNLADMVGLKVKVSGDGFVQKQSLSAGQSLTKNETLVVTLK
ncbi:penicillin-binding transpeptidase domain-containing protein [Levilactobacillus bambusae]|uniref:Penicillin-binding protein n=1 Tax=Levilactobacillus bambusae TaxID=2024736 RepID=A0A2V1N089_9LACO|nr:penicillin-binding transpeptidase domain-containing protein [Levilactobacillus bambusae]PWG00634.1 penicillin-binding protein [Levilactobacillus bambusae]